jgi:hypothetical protein
VVWCGRGLREGWGVDRLLIVCKIVDITPPIAYQTIPTHPYSLPQNQATIPITTTITNVKQRIDSHKGKEDTTSSLS